MTDDIAPTIFELASRPGFLIRRLHQIHVALFIEECAGFDITPVQYSILTVAQEHPGLDQASLGELAGVDRATTANVVARLEARGLAQRQASSMDRRLRLVSLTPAGTELLGQIEEPARRAHARTVSALHGQERRAFIKGLTRLVQAGNGHGRAPLLLG